jgi:hypothetical protein
VNRRRGCSRPIVVGLAVLAVLACAALGSCALLYYRLQQARAQNEPPSVTITEPAKGASTLAESYMGVSAMAFGGIPITRAELWVDGELVDTEDTRIEGGISPFYVSFELLVPQGLHTVFVRAVNATGLIGDSWPVNVGGVERAGADEPARLVTVEEDQTLTDICTVYDCNPETAGQLNPNLHGQQPPVGSTVVLPPPQSKTAPGPGEPPAGPSVGPTIPPSGPTGTGTLPSPSGPPLQVIAPSPLPVDVGGLVGALVDPWTPAAPTNLQAEVTDCNIRLRWNDNSNNEQRYEVWYLWNFGQAPRLIAKLNPAKGGQVWYEFPAPSWGAFIFWVEAVNGVGTQPSNKVGALVSLTTCGQTLAKELQVEALDMTVPSGYGQVYCYVSFEGAAHVRVPADTKDFIQVTGGKGNIASWASGNKKLVVPIPGDDSLEAEGECWGRSGGKLGKFGTFSGKYSRPTWDGVRRQLPGTGFEIGVAIKPLGGALDTSGLLTTYSYEDPTLPVPYDVVEHKLYSPWPIDPLLRSLSWKYDNPKNVTLTGFQILLNGAPYNPGGGWSLVAPTARSADVRLPKDCGMHITWQVRAVSGQAQSRLSASAKENDYDLPKCPEPMYAMVKWNTITFIRNCDDLDLYWGLRVNGVSKVFYWSCEAYPVGPGCWGTWPHIDGNCGPHSLASLGQFEHPYPDTVVASLGQTTTGGGAGPLSIEVRDWVWDTLNFCCDELAGVHEVVYNFASLEEAQHKLGCGREVCVGPGTGDPYASEYAGRYASVCYTLYIFPQAEGLDCPVKQPAYTP